MEPPLSRLTVNIFLHQIKIYRLIYYLLSYSAAISTAATSDKTSRASQGAFITEADDTHIAVDR